MEFISDLWLFVKTRKKYWLLPLILILILMGFLVVFTSGTAIQPFTYTLF